MNSKQFQLNRRSVVALLLAALTLIMTVMPALAWEDEGGPDFKPARSCQVSAIGEGWCGQMTPYHHKPVVSERPIAPLGVIGAETFFLRGWQSAQSVVEAGKE